MSEKITDKTIGLILVLVFLLAIIIFGLPIIVRGCSYTTEEHSLSELNSKYYGIYTSIHSNIHDNLETVILNVDGQVMTLKGDVNVHFVKDNYRVIWKYNEPHRCDEIDIYVPDGSIEFYYDVAISR